MKTTGASKRVTSQDRTAIAEGGAEEVDRSGQNSDFMPSVMGLEAAEHGGGLVETTPTHDSKDRDEPPDGTVSLLDSPNDPSHKEGGTSMLANPRTAKYVDGTTPTKSKVPM